MNVRDIELGMPILLKPERQAAYCLESAVVVPVGFRPNGHTATPFVIGESGECFKPSDFKGPARKG